MGFTLGCESDVGWGQGLPLLPLGPSLGAWVLTGPEQGGSSIQASEMGPGAACSEITLSYLLATLPIFPRGASDPRGALRKKGDCHGGCQRRVTRSLSTR